MYVYFILCSIQHPFYIVLYTASFSLLLFVFILLVCIILAIPHYMSSSLHRYVFPCHLSDTFLCNCTQGLGTMANSAERPKQDLQHWGCCAEDLVAGHLGLRWTLSG